MLGCFFVGYFVDWLGVLVIGLFVIVTTCSGRDGCLLLFDLCFGLIAGLPLICFTFVVGLCLVF